MALSAFLITIGILVIVHELGHYLAARAFNIKILTFSIGFGPKILKLKGKYNDWTVGLIPLGGYVRMLDEREQEVEPSQKKFCFNNKKPYQKILVALAGPIFNLLFAIIVYYILGIVGVSEVKPIIASINPYVGIQEAKLLKPNILINSIAGKKVSTWNEADKLFHLALSESDLVAVNITDQKSDIITNLTLDLHQERINYNKELYLETIGVYPYSYLAKISYIEPNSPAYNAGLKINDQIIGVNGVVNNNWFSIANQIRRSIDKPLIFDVKRQAIGDLTVKVQPVLQDNDGVLYGKVGIMPTLNQAQLAHNSFTYRYNVLNSIGYAIKSCYMIVAINLSFLRDMISGNMGVSNLGGPISIAKAGSSALEGGFKHFADFLAVISLGLAIMNLLPIPVLDGGHVVIYLVEWVIGHEVSHTLQGLIFRVGFVLVVGISLLAIYNDVLRL